MNKNKKMFKNPVQMVIYIIIFCVLIAAFVYLGKQNYKKVGLSDQEKFSRDFDLVDGNNVFVYANNREVRTVLNKGTAIVFFGTNQSIWTQHYAKILNDIALYCGIDKIYYYDFIEDRNNANATYQSIVEKVSGYVKTNDIGNKELYAPSLVVIKNGVIIYFDDETSFVVGNATPSQYWNQERLLQKQTEFIDAFYDYLGVELDGE